jgi:glutamine---fructose-6-phosphate transaminase (isomerizing)
MCGIIGIISEHDVSLPILEGLKRLEYRGYDSAGIATIYNGKVARERAKGKLIHLETLLKNSVLHGKTGIGHTRWATHGAPNETNAHPHATDKVAVVHNGIIENYKELREELQQNGVIFESQTDTEVIPHLVTAFLQGGHSPQKAVSETLKKLRGAFALGIIFSDHPDLLIAARRGSPLAIGYGDGAMYIGSDAIALAPYTQKISYMEEGDWAVLTQSSVQIFNEQDAPVTREVRQTMLSGAATGKGNYRHFMLKEIHEQPTVVGQTLNVFFNSEDSTIRLPALPFDLKSFDRISMVACGTSHYASLVARYWIEQLAHIPVDMDIASEFRYRTHQFSPKQLAVFVSQSGETADTLAAMRACKAAGVKTLCIVNVPESSMANEADAALYTYAGPEIGVASTKAFTTQLTTLACFALELAQIRGTLTKEQIQKLTHAISEVPARMAEILHHESSMLEVAHTISQSRDALYIGRGPSYAIALEGALKLKEISYIHAEGYAAGELKHGPIALIDDKVPVVVIAPSDHLFEKTASNLQEAMARGGNIILISDEKGIAHSGDQAKHIIKLPTVHPFVAPILFAIPVQLIAYHVAILKGTDVDQPRNLAKSVTVE